LLGPVVVYLFAFSIFPLLYSLVIAFQDYEVRTTSFTFTGLENFRLMVDDPRFWTATINSAVMTVSGVALQVFLGATLAIFLSRNLRGTSLVRAILILPLLLTPIVVGLMWRALLNPDWGIVNYLLEEVGISPPLWLGDPSLAIWTLVGVDTWQWTPFVVIVVFARLQALPADPFEAAQVDGASAWQVLRRITLPLLAPAIVFVAIFRAIDAFRSFDVVFGLTYGGPGNTTTTLSFYAYENGYTFQRYGYASAIAYVMVVVATIAITVLFRHVAVRRADAS
jgi:multiple sugar transport system permease protein